MILADFDTRLPFIDDNDCALGIAAKSYLDELAARVDSTSDAAKKEVKKKGSEEWIPNSVDFTADLESAFRLWDAVSLTPLFDSRTCVVCG